MALGRQACSGSSARQALAPPRPHPLISPESGSGSCGNRWLPPCAAHGLRVCWLALHSQRECFLKIGLSPASIVLDLTGDVRWSLRLRIRGEGSFIVFLISSLTAGIVGSCAAPRCRHGSAGICLHVAVAVTPADRTHDGGFLRRIRRLPGPCRRCGLGNILG